MLSSSEPRIEHFRRQQGGWALPDLRGQGSVRLEAFGISLDLRDSYASVLTPKEAHARRTHRAELTCR